MGNILKTMASQLKEDSPIQNSNNTLLSKLQKNNFEEKHQFTKNRGNAKLITRSQTLQKQKEKQKQTIKTMTKESRVEDRNFYCAHVES